MATTAKGYPYPVGTDRVMDGDNAIQALAEAVDGKIGIVAAGIANVNVVTGGTTASVSFTFPVGRFTVAPVCVGNAQSSNPPAITGGVGPNLTTGGGTAYANRGSPAVVPVSWIAVQV